MSRQSSCPKDSLFLRKKAPVLIHSTLADRSVSLSPIFSPITVIEAVHLSQTSVEDILHQFTRPISPACDQFIQYLHMWINPSILNRHRWGLPPWRSRLSTSLSPSIPIEGPPLSPNGPVRSKVNILNIILQQLNE
jgi:hypothetical protein